MKKNPKQLKERARDRRAFERGMLRVMRFVHLSSETTDLSTVQQRELVALERARRRLTK